MTVQRGSFEIAMSARCVVALLALAAPALAQPAPPVPPAAQAAPAQPPAAVVAARPLSREEALRGRYQLRVMEGVLENAVQHGIRSVGAQMRLVSPDLIFFGSPARARGFRLDGYGVFFDVDVPTLRPSVAWSVRTLSQINPETTKAIQSLRRIVESQGDARAKRDAENALRLVEMQVGPMTENTVEAGGGLAGAATPPDPAVAYEAEVKRALVDAMLDYGNTITLGPDDWLSVAARATDAMGQDGTDVVTVLLKFRAGDLHAWRLGQISRDEIRQKVVVQEF